MGITRLIWLVGCGTMFSVAAGLPGCHRPEHPARRPTTVATAGYRPATGAEMDVDTRTAPAGDRLLSHAAQVEALLVSARNGCPRSLGQLFEMLRGRLAGVAAEELPDVLRAKVGPSDLVQETAIDMQRNFGMFRGTTAEECFAWLRSILRNNLVDAVRHYESTHKRELAREQRLDGQARRDGAMAVCNRLPDGSAMRHEDAVSINLVLARLPDDQRAVIELRYWRGLSFADIGIAMDRTAGAARKLWYRAIERLQAELAADRGVTSPADDPPATRHT